MTEEAYTRARAEIQALIDRKDVTALGQVAYLMLDNMKRDAERWVALCNEIKGRRPRHG